MSAETMEISEQVFDIGESLANIEHLLQGLAENIGEWRDASPELKRSANEAFYAIELLNAEWTANLRDAEHLSPDESELADLRDDQRRAEEKDES